MALESGLLVRWIAEFVALKDEFVALEKIMKLSFGYVKAGLMLFEPGLIGNSPSLELVGELSWRVEDKCFCAK